MQRSIKPVHAPIHYKIILPGATSMSYRALLLAALADGVSEISGLRLTDAVRTFISALHQLGIVTQLDEKSNSCIIAGGNGKFPKKQSTVWCANEKIVAKFLLAAVAPTAGVFYFDGGLEVRKKPLTNMLNLLERQGIQLIPNDARTLPFTLIGSDSLQGGEINLDKKTNSQMLSALLMISPFARTPFSFNIPDLATQPNINMTCALMNEFGVLVHRYHQGQFTVPVPQRYQAKDIIIEPDFAIATYFFAACAITNGQLTIQASKPLISKQFDAQLLAFLEKMGCKMHEANNGFTLKGSTELQGLDISLQKFSATFLALVAMAPFAKSPTRITHVGSLNKKEKNKLIAIKVELSKLGIHTETGDTWIKIFPGTPKGCLVNSHHDAHIAMALAVIGLKTPGVTIDNAGCITQVYPEFFTVWEQLAESSNISV